MNTPNIVFTGFMGTGKSTVGKILAASLGYQFCDTDKLIEAQENRTVARIFAESGEQAFRKMENAIAKILSKQSAQVIATGGGLMLNSENRETLGHNAYIFCLTASPAEIIQRLLESDGQQQRPLLKSENPKAQIIQLMQERAGVYSQFPNIDTDGKSPSQIADEIVAKLNDLQIS